MKRHAKRNGCQARIGKRHAERIRDLKKKTCQATQRRQEKDAKTSRARIFNEKACREKRMSGKRHAERIRDFKKKTCQGKDRCQEKNAKTSRERDFNEKACQEKRMSGKNRKETCRENKRPQEKDMPRERE